MSKIIYIDNTLLSKALVCDTQAVMFGVHGLRSTRDKAVFELGKAVHQGMEVHLTGSSPEASLKVVMEGREGNEYDVRYREWSEEHLTPDDRLWHENIEKIMRVWFHTHPTSSLPYKVPSKKHVERGFVLPLVEYKDHLVMYCGRLDALAVMDGQWWIVEHKTAKYTTDYWLKRFFLNSQITGYIWAMKQIKKSVLGESKVPVRGIILNGVNIPDIPRSNNKCPKHKQPYHACAGQHTKHRPIIKIERSQAVINSWRRTAIWAAKRYVNLLLKHTDNIPGVKTACTQGMFQYDACSDCAYLDFCRSGRTPRNAKLMFKHDPWSPFDHAKAARKCITKKKETVQ